VAFWNLISFFVEVVATCFVSLSTWACNLLGFVARLLLPCLPIGYFVDLKITLSKRLFWHLALLLMVTTDFIAVSFLAIRKWVYYPSCFNVIVGVPYQVHHHRHHQPS
jgi:hypothetical protein